MSVLAVDGLRVRIGGTTIVDGVDYEVGQSEIFGIAGESGSGKTMSMLALLGLLPDRSSVEGTANFGGRDLLAMRRGELRALSGRDLAMVFQDPFTSLHPMLTVGKQLTEHVRLHLGLGAQPPTAEWGSMVADGTQYFQWWWIGTFPGLAIFTVVLAFNVLGDSLRDVFDPRTARRVEEAP